MSRRLLESDRENILNKVMTTTFKERKEVLARENNAIAEVIYNTLYPDAIRVKMNALPEEFFAQKSTMNALIGQTTYTFSLKSSRKISADDNEYKRPRLGVDNANPLKERVLNYQKAKDKLELDKDNFKREIKGFLKGIHTLKKLKEVWPEGEVYYSYLNTEKPNLPVVQTTDINKLILEMKEL